MKKNLKHLSSIMVLGVFLVLAAGSVDSQESSNQSSTRKPIKDDLEPKLEKRIEESTEKAQEKAQKYVDQEEQDWEEFTSAIGQFKVLFPNYPEHTTEEIEAPNSNEVIDIEMYFSQQGDEVVYFITYVDYGKDSEVSDLNPKVILEGALNGMLGSNSETKLNYSKIVNYEGHKALDFVIEQGNTIMKGKIILVGSEMYQVFVNYEKGRTIERNYQKFLDSFEILD